MAFTVIHRFFRNKELNDWVDQQNWSHDQREAAWEMWAYLKTTYPEISPIIRGELMEE